MFDSVLDRSGRTALRAIVYVSSATRPMGVPELEALLAEARTLNLENAVTGILLYKNGYFMQCFEGREEDVHDTYARIRASRQHTNIVELMNEQVDARSFPDWQMGYAQPERTEWTALRESNWHSRASEALCAVADSPGMDLLRGIASRVHP